MITKKNRKQANAHRHYKIRKNIHGTSERPRLAVHKSNKHIYAQLIDDVKKVTLVAASTVEKSFTESDKSGANVDAAKEIGKLIGDRAKEKGIDVVVFDRGGFLYHGRIAALADGAREAGLVF